MVQILRDQQRNYAADQTSAIKTAQIAQNIQEVGQVAGAAKSLIGAVDSYNKSVTAEAVAADKTVINTEIGNKANQEINDWALTKGADYLNSPAGRAEIEKRSAEVYAKYGESVGTQEAKDYLSKMQRDQADRLIAGASKDYNSETAKKARATAAKLQKDMQYSAFEYGKKWDIDGYRESSGESIDAVVDHLSKSRGISKEIALAAVESERTVGFLSGALETYPEYVASAIGDEEAQKSILEYRIKTENPDISDDAVKQMVESKYNEVWSDQNNIQERTELVESLIGEGTTEHFKNTRISELKSEKADLQQQLRFSGGKRKEALKKEIKKIDSRIESNDNTPAVDIFQRDMKKFLGGEVLKKVRLQEHQLEQRRYENTVDTYTAAMNPDFLQSAESKLMLDQLLGREKNQTYRGEAEVKANQAAQTANMSVNPENAVKMSLRGEVNYDDLMVQVGTFLNNSKKVKSVDYGSYTGTIKMNESLINLLSDNTKTEAQVMYAAYEALNAAYDSPITQKQYDDFNQIVFQATQDKSFGNDVAKALTNADKYFPDTSWMANTFAGSPHSEDYAVAGGDTTSNAIRRSDVDTARKRYDTGTQDIYQAGLSMTAEVAKLPTPEARSAGMREVEKFIVDQKKDLHDDLMANYGINLKYLDEQLDKKGYAFTQIGFQIREYKGRRDDGTPIFKRAVVQSINNAERDRLNRVLEGIG